MPRRAPIPKCSKEDKKVLQQLAGSRTEEARLVERAKIILKCLQGERVHKIAKDLRIRPNTVIDCGVGSRKKVLKDSRINLAVENPHATSGISWRSSEYLGASCAGRSSPLDGPAVAKHLDTSVHAVWRLLRKKEYV